MTSITDLFRRSLLIGIGAVSLTTERAQELVNDLVKRGEVSQEQGQSMVKELVKRGDEARDQLSDIVKTQVKMALRELDLPMKQDLRRIEDKIDRLILMQEPIIQTRGEELGGPVQGPSAEHKEPGEASPEIF